MAAQIVMRGANLVPAGLVLIAVLIGAEGAWAGFGHYETTGAIAEASGPSDLVAAELDPVFVQKLARRSRAPYQRAHPWPAQPRD